MASRSIGGVFAELSLRDTKFRTGLQKARNSMNRFGAAAVRAGAIATTALAAGMVAGTKRAISMGAELDHLSTQTGLAVSELMRIQQAYKDNGKSADSAAKDINKMQRAIFEASQDPGGSMDFFTPIGLNIQKLMAMSPDEQFFAIGEAINKIKSPTERAARAMDIFGRSGGQLITVFKGSNLDDVNTSLGKMPEIIQEFSVELERADTLLGRLPNKSDQFFAGFTAGIVEELIPSLEDINEFDFSQLGKNLADSLISVAQEWAVLMNATFDTLTGQSSFKDAVNKYSSAQEAISQERENERLARKAEKEEEKRLAKEEQAAAEFYENVRRMEHESAPDYVDPKDAVKAAVSMPDITAMMDEARSRTTDEYQSRGLSLSKSPEQTQIKTQTALLQSMLDIFKRAETADRELKFT